MEKSITKWFFIAGTLLFADWLIMILFGCASKICKADHDFFCSIYCKIGIGLIIFTLLLIFWLSVVENKKGKG